MAQFDLSQLYRAAFGYVGSYGTISHGTEVTKADPYGALPGGVTRGGEPGLLGSIIHLPLKLDDVPMPNEPLISVSGRKHIVTTEIDGQDGTFKELYSMGDYSIKIQGILVNDDDPDNYPEAQVRELRRIIELRRHVKVSNAITGYFNIAHLAIESYDFPAMPGQIGAQAYELNCISDRDFQLVLREKR